MRRKLVAAVVAALSLSVLAVPATAETPFDVDGDDNGYLCVRWEKYNFSQCVNWFE